MNDLLGTVPAATLELPLSTCSAGLSVQRKLKSAPYFIRMSLSDKVAQGWRDEV